MKNETLMKPVELLKENCDINLIVDKGECFLIYLYGGTAKYQYILFVTK